MTEREPEYGRKSRADLPSLSAIVEAILFASDRPVSVSALREAIPEADEEALLAAISELMERYESHTSGVGLQEIADGYQLTTRPQLSAYVERFLVGRRRARLSRAALETLATIAYRQPITRGEIEDLRGVDCGQVIHTLLTRELITVRGRSEALGRPLLYGTTPEFLNYFGLRSLSDLPSLDELRALSQVDPLADPEIREALEANGLLEDASSLADPGSDAVGSVQDEEGSEAENAASNGAKDDDLEPPHATGKLEAREAEGEPSAGVDAPDAESEPANGRLESHDAKAEPVNGRVQAHDTENESANGRLNAHHPEAAGRNGARRQRALRKTPTLRIVEAESAVPLPENGEYVVTEGNGGPR